MKKVVTEKAPQPVGPYTQGMRVGNTLFCSGQAGLVPDTGQLISDDVKEQTLQTLQNLEAVLNAAGLKKNHVVKANIYLTDMNDFNLMNEVYGAFFAPHTPSRTTVAVAGLPVNAKVEIECIAEFPEE